MRRLWRRKPDMERQWADLRALADALGCRVDVTLGHKDSPVFVDWTSDTTLAGHLAAVSDALTSEKWSDFMARAIETDAAAERLRVAQDAEARARWALRGAALIRIFEGK